MATGSGKTYTAVNSIYRLIKFGGARRVLFLVDRDNLAKQTFDEFQQFLTPDDGRKFTELYYVQHMRGRTIDKASRVCITNIQRLYSLLRGNEETDDATNAQSLFEQEEGCTGYLEHPFTEKDGFCERMFQVASTGVSQRVRHGSDSSTEFESIFYLLQSGATASIAGVFDSCCCVLQAVKRVHNE